VVGVIDNVINDRMVCDVDDETDTFMMKEAMVTKILGGSQPSSGKNWIMWHSSRNYCQL
jgi:hypothetical protein